MQSADNRWALLERFDIPHLDRPGVTYLSRLRIIQTPLFGIYLHKMNTEDSRPVFHDHPYAFVSFILRGGYIEERLNMKTRVSNRRARRFINIMRRDDAHYIKSLMRVPTWTLLLIGARRRKWGFWRRTSNTGTWTWTPFDEDETATVSPKHYMNARQAQGGQ